MDKHNEQEQNYRVEYPSDEEKDVQITKYNMGEEEEHSLLMSVSNSLQLKRPRQEPEITDSDEIGKQECGQKRARLCWNLDQEDIETDLIDYQLQAEEAGQTTPPTSS